MPPVRALVITGFGLNCEVETTAAWRLAGAEPTQLHLNDLLAEPERLADFQVLTFIGGFAFGDHLGAGTVFANRVKYRLGDPLRAFVGAGNLVLGICNGFQTLTRLGLLPALDGRLFDVQVALAANHQGVFRDAWVDLQATPASPCVFTKGLHRLSLPIRHGEGRFVVRDPAVLARLEREHLVALRYVTPDGETAEEFPDNPNGSVHAIAGLCDPSGRIFGLMPHPEAYLSPVNHPQWQAQQRRGELPAEGLGLALFRQATDFANDHLQT